FDRAQYAIEHALVECRRCAGNLERDLSGTSGRHDGGEGPADVGGSTQAHHRLRCPPDSSNVAASDHPASSIQLSNGSSGTEAGSSARLNAPSTCRALETAARDTWIG